MRAREYKLTGLVALLGALLTGCGAAYPTCAADPYGTTGACLTQSGTSGYDSSYSDTSYSTGSTYDSSYSSSYDTSYTSTYPTTTTGTTTIDPNTGYAITTPTTATTGSPVATSAPAAPPVLSAFVKDTKEQGLLGLGGLLAHVEVTNPTNRALSGLLHVVFTHSGSPTGAAQTQRVTLKPLETQVMTFTTSTYNVNDAETTIDTDGVADTDSSVSNSSVVDLK